MRTLSGKGVGREIEPLLRRAKKRIWVVSPFISEKYAKLLIKKAEEGVDVRVITTERSAKMFRPKRFILTKTAASLLSLASVVEPPLLIIPVILVCYIFKLEGLVISVVGGLISVLLQSHLPLSFLLSAYPLIRKGKLRVVTTSKTFVHSKLYVIDDVAISGSANLTVSGLWKNYETITIFEGREARDVVSLFKKMWNEISSA